ncbi:hypothetical protein ACFXTN_005834 [Malus domestica]
MNIGMASMTGNIKTCNFVIHRDPQNLELVKGVEERTHCQADPAHNGQKLNHLGSEQPPSAAHKETVRPYCTDGACIIGLDNKLLFREQPCKYQTPRTTPTVQLGRL